MKLISMTDFVLEQDKKRVSFSEAELKNTYYNNLDYTNFINQSLELWMFIPCRYNGSQWVLFKKPDRPLDTDLYSNVDNPITHEWKEYQKAKERVLFEGEFRWTKKYPTYIQIMKVIVVDVVGSNTIESLVNYEFEFNLTPTALKQIGL